MRKLTFTMQAFNIPWQSTEELHMFQKIDDVGKTNLKAIVLGRPQNTNLVDNLNYFN